MRLIALILLSILLISSSSYSQEIATGTISLGPVKVGENRLPLSPDSFDIKFQYPAPYLDVKLMKESLQWIRTKSNVLLPRMKIFFILLNRDYSSYSLKYAKESFLFQFSRNGAISQINYSLFQPAPIEIYRDGKLINVMIIRPIPPKEKTGLIDYSCARYGVDIEVPTHRYYSVGCVENITGPLGNEKKNVEISWIIPEMTLLDRSLPPFVTNFIDAGVVETKLVDSFNKVESIKVTTKFDNQYHRLNLALGLGAYSFLSIQGEDTTGEKITSPLFLYGNYTLNLETSIRLFNAFAYASDSYFNNAGLYIAYDVAKIFDSRIVVTPLFGFQLVTHSHKEGPSKTQELFPQGFELVYKHAFGKKNYVLGFGTFISTSSDDEYQNTWIRYGKKTFFELNYLSWKEDDRYTKTWGLSLGFPIGSFF